MQRCDEHETRSEVSPYNVFKLYVSFKEVAFFYVFKIEIWRYFKGVLKLSQIDSNLENVLKVILCN